MDFNTFIIVLINTLLISLNILLLVEYLNITIHNSNNKKHLTSTGISALMLLIGAGCISCSATLLGGLVSTSLIGYFPFAGRTFQIISIVILLISCYNLNKKLNNPYVC
jgi:hypothetical protein